MNTIRKPVPNDQQLNDHPVVTNSWTSYQEFITCIKEFLNAISIRDAEVWLDEVCLGSPDHPWIRAPFQINSVERVGQTIACAQRLISGVHGSLHSTIETSRREMEVLINKGA